MLEVIIQNISNSLSIPVKSIEATVSLLEGGATIPFISRYRKEATGSLDEEKVAAIQQQLKRLKELNKRKEAIIKSIKEQDKLTSELEKKINNCWILSELEDLYLPYKPKRKTRASAAKEKGLEPLAKMIMAQRDHDILYKAKSFIKGEVNTVEGAMAGARDIIAEWISESTNARQTMRKLFEYDAVISSKVVAKKKSEGDKYRDYFDYSEALKRCPGHRILAIRRAEQEGVLKVSITIDEKYAQSRLEKIFIKQHSPTEDQIQLAIKDAYKRLIAPSLETEFKNEAKTKADEEAIAVFSQNVRQLLLAAPLGGKPTLALDPGFRTGCKLVCLNKQGALQYHTTIYPHPPQEDTHKASDVIKTLVNKYDIKAIAIGNGTAGRETMQFIQSVLGKDTSVEIFMVNEAGASIYSASEVARNEFPDLDLTVRGAISIGRRLMDPLAELVKIDAKSIGVGQYQYDVNQERLKDSLDQTVSSVVNQVGVNLSTASYHLLSYVSGIGPKLAQSIVNHRKKNGTFNTRKDLMKVDGLGAKAYEQAAGFLRIPNAKNPLDNSAVHPERYAIIAQMAKDISKPVEDLIHNSSTIKEININQYTSHEVGLPTLQDILKELEKPGLDPRGEAETFSFDESIKEITDLRPGMRLPGVVTNLTKFGAFVDIGIKENGLVHISQITDRFIKDPAEVLSLDQKVSVKIKEVDLNRKRVQLTMKEN